MTALRIEACPSPNHGERITGPVDILLLHYTGMPDDEQSLAWLCHPKSQVSSHYFVHANGRVLQLVPEDRRAWHAGAASWGGKGDINSRSIGIEIANSGHPGGLPDFPQVQIEALIALCRVIVTRNSIPPRGVLGHSDVAPGRKIDPGERFPWGRLATAGIGHFIHPAPVTNGPLLRRDDDGPQVEGLQMLCALYGYDVAITGVFDQRTVDVVAAFQRHFRPARVDGVADISTISTLQRLIAALP